MFGSNRLNRNQSGAVRIALNHALTNYQRTAVETGQSLQLIIMCYDAAVRDLEEARDMHERRGMDAAYPKIRHAQDVVTELLVGLDYERSSCELRSAW